MADLGREVKSFPSSSTAGKFYVVKEKEGVLSCNCPPWIFNRNGNRTCKHTEICRKELGLKAPEPVEKIVPAKKAMPDNWVHPLMKGKVKGTKEKNCWVPPQVSHNAGPEHYCPECKGPECEAKPLTDAELNRAVKNPFVVDVIAPMLASKGEPLKILQVAEDPGWIAERKLDGSRYGLYIGKDGNRLLSKHISVKDDKPVEKTENVPHLTKVSCPELDGTVIDGEITTPNGDFGNVVSVMGSHPFEAIEKQKRDGNMLYTVFDCPRYKGQDITKRSLRERQTVLKEVIKTLGIPEIKFIEQRSENRMAWFKEIVKEGGEGIILKRWDSHYEAGKRGPNWIKVKKMQTYDVVVMGFKETKSEAWQAQGLIGAVVFGCYNAAGKLQEVGDTSGMTLEVRRDMSANPDKWIGTVVEVAGQEVLRDAIRHPRYIRTRPDVSPKACTIQKLMVS
jgi:ATP-dependent DNA ligase